MEAYLGATVYDISTGLGIDGGYYYTRLAYKFEDISSFDGADIVVRGGVRLNL